jgi:hypothetical protein
VKEVIPGPPEQAFQDGPRGTDIFLCPEVSLLELSDGHLFWPEDCVTHVVMGPVAVKDSSFLFQSLLKRGPGEGSENRKSGKFNIIFLNELNCFFKNGGVISIESKDERTLNPDLMMLNRFDPIR